MCKTTLDLIHEEGHAKAIIDIISKNKNYEQYASTPPLILIGDYKNNDAESGSPEKSEVCNANIIFYEPYDKGSRALTLHLCMDAMNNTEIRACAIAGYKAELSFILQNKNFKSILRWFWDYIRSSDLLYFIMPNIFRKKSPCGFDSYTDAFIFYCNAYRKSCRKKPIQV